MHSTLIPSFLLISTKYKGGIFKKCISKGIVRLCREKVRKAKAQLEDDLVISVKDNKILK